VAWFVGPASALTGDTYDDFVGGVARFGNLIPDNFEMRFVEGGGKGAIYSETGTFGDPILIDVPFELWNVRTTDSPDDDVRLFPTIFDLDFSLPPGGQAFSMISDAGIQETFGCCGGDSGMSGANNDPYSDGITWLVPADNSPGQAGYDAIVAAIEADPAAANPMLAELPIAFRRMALVAWNAGDTGVDPLPYDQFEFPEVGTVFKIITTKPLAIGDEYALDSSPVAPGVDVDPNDVVDLIGITPNPYKGASAYDPGTFQNEARFVNLPEKATIRVFALNGTLIRTLEKNSPESFLRWDLTTQDGLPVASGMYLIYVQTDEGNKVLKFGVVMNQLQLDVF
jgi:hypothetical protein